MPAPKGNKNAKGNRGGGRKSAYQERGDAEALWAMFEDQKKIKDIKAKIESGKYSVKDVMQMKLLTGNERLISEVFKKLFPDLEKVEHSGGINITVTDYEEGKESKK